MAASDYQTQTTAQTFSTNANTARFKEMEVAIKHQQEATKQHQEALIRVHARCVNVESQVL
jgi:ribosomal protein S11